MRRFLTVLNKEWVDARRDRRSVLAALFFAFFGPGMVAGMIFFMASQVEESERPESEVVVKGAAYAPALIKALKKAGITVKQDENAGPELVRRKVTETVLVIPETFQKDFLASRPAKIILYTDQTQRFTANLLENEIRRYHYSVREARMLARGVAPSQLRPFDIQKHDVSTAGAVASGLADLIMYFFIFAPFYASMAMAMDMTVGERQRDSLQPLLVQPVHAITLVMGKWSVASFFGIIGSAITVVLASLVIDYAPIEQLGTSLAFGPMTQVAMVLVLVPLALMVAAIQMTIALLARSFREAQTYISLLSFAPIALGLYTIFSDTNDISPYVPILLQIEQLNALAFGEGPSLTGIAVSIGTTFITTGICLLISAHMLRRERMLQVS